MGCPNSCVFQKSRGQNLDKFFEKQKKNAVIFFGIISQKQTGMFLTASRSSQIRISIFRIFVYLDQMIKKWTQKVVSTANILEMYCPKKNKIRKKFEKVAPQLHALCDSSTFGMRSRSNSKTAKRKLVIPFFPP